jgi:MSHA biogenesis protein MshL
MKPRRCRDAGGPPLRTTIMNLKFGIHLRLPSRGAISCVLALIACLGNLQAAEDGAQPRQKSKRPVFSDLPEVEPQKNSVAAAEATPSQPASSEIADAAPVTNAPVTPAPAAPPQVSVPPPTEPAPKTPSLMIPPSKPATSPPLLLDDEKREKRLYSFQASDLDLRTALAAFARANDLNIVPDNDIAGTITLDVRDLPLSQMMRALLEASDCAWHEQGGLIRVRNVDTRTFVIDYLRMTRHGMGQSSAMLASGSGGGGGMGSGTSGGMNGGMGGGSSGNGGGSSSGGSVSSAGGSSINLTADNAIDFWKELKEEMGFMLTPQGKASMAINMTAGLVQITDRPSALKRVQDYLSSVDQTVHRQVDIETKLYDVTLGDQFQFGIDWVHVAEAYGGAMGYGAATLPVAIGGTQLHDSALSGLGRGGPGFANPVTLVFTNFNTSAAVNALKEQGKVEVISKPRIRTLNNQTALIKVGTEEPFFASSYSSQQSQSGNVTYSGDIITTVTVGTILSITPQVSEDDWISLDISPVLTSLEGTKLSPSKTATAPVLDTKQASTLVRVRDGTTVVLGGLIQNTTARNDTKIPLLGDIPLLGRLFTGTFRFNQKKELVMFVTPHIIRNDTDTQHPPELRAEMK